MEIIDNIEEKDINILKEIASKHNVSGLDMIIITTMLQSMGYGRNKNTANALRAVADMIESPLTCAETLEAKVNGKLQ